MRQIKECAPKIVLHRSPIVHQTVLWTFEKPFGKRGS